MIIIKLADSSPQTSEGMAVKLTGQTLPEITPAATNDFCYCETECKYKPLVFAKVGGEDYQNDKSQFLFKRLVSGDTVDIKLFKDGVELADLNNNTYGTFFNGFATGTAEQQLYVGYLLEWEEVFNLHGAGAYMVKAELNIVGVTSTFSSDPFILMGYSDQAADLTVKIETVQNGNILGSQFDFTGLNWFQSLRVRGNFYEDSEAFEKNAYLTQNYKQKQIQDKIIENWTLQLNFIPRNISEFLTKNAILSNEFKITDYNLSNEKILREISVYPESVEKTRLTNNRKSNYLIKFTSKLDNLIKRNY